MVKLNMSKDIASDIKKAVTDVFGTFDDLQRMQKANKVKTCAFMAPSRFRDPEGNIKKMTEVIKMNDERQKKEADRIKQSVHEKLKYEKEKAEYSAWYDRRKIHQAKRSEPFLEIPPRVSQKVLDLFAQKDRELLAQSLMPPPLLPLDVIMKNGDTPSPSSSTSKPPHSRDRVHSHRDDKPHRNSSLSKPIVDPLPMPRVLKVKEEVKVEARKKTPPKDVFDDLSPVYEAALRDEKVVTQVSVSSSTTVVANVPETRKRDIMSDLFGDDDEMETSRPSSAAAAPLPSEPQVTKDKEISGPPMKRIKLSPSKDTIPSSSSIPATSSSTLPAKEKKAKKDKKEKKEKKEKKKEKQRLDSSNSKPVVDPIPSVGKVKEEVTKKIPPKDDLPLIHEAALRDEKAVTQVSVTSSTTITANVPESRKRDMLSDLFGDDDEMKTSHPSSAAAPSIMPASEPQATKNKEISGQPVKRIKLSPSKDTPQVAKSEEISGPPVKRIKMSLSKDIVPSSSIPAASSSTSPKKEKKAKKDKKEKKEKKEKKKEKQRLDSSNSKPVFDQLPVPNVVKVKEEVKVEVTEKTPPKDDLLPIHEAALHDKKAVTQVSATSSTTITANIPESRKRDMMSDLFGDDDEMDSQIPSLSQIPDLFGDEEMKTSRPSSAAADSEPQVTKNKEISGPPMKRIKMSPSKDTVPSSSSIPAASSSTSPKKEKKAKKDKKEKKEKKKEKQRLEEEESKKSDGDKEKKKHKKHKKKEKESDE